MTTHRLALLLAVAALAAASPPAAAEDKKSWTGESVMHTKQPKDIRFGDQVDGKQVWFAYSGMLPTKVREDREGWLRLHDGHNEGWADKDDFILVNDAPAYFHRRVQADPKDTWALGMRGIGWVQKGEYDNAIKDFDKCVRLDPTSASDFNWRGIAYSGKKDYDRAIKDYDGAIRLDPNFATVFCNRGIAYSGKKDYDRAIENYSEASRLDPKYAPAFVGRGNAYSNKKDYDRAVADYDEAIRLDPKYALAFDNRGLAYSNKKDYDRAIKDYDEAIRLDPKSASAFDERGDAHMAKKDYDRAITDYDEAIRLDPKYTTAFRDRAAAHTAKKDYDRAITDYDEVIRLEPKDAYAPFYRSVAQMITRRTVCVKGFQAVLDLQGWKGDRTVYAVILGHLAAGQAGDDAAAKRFLADCAGKLDAAWPEPAVRFLRGDLDEPGLLKLATDDDKRTEARCYLGLHHANHGRPAEALAHYRWVKEHGTPASAEYGIAVTELDRLAAAAKP